MSRKRARKERCPGSDVTKNKYMCFCRSMAGPHRSRRGFPPFRFFKPCRQPRNPNGGPFRGKPRHMGFVTFPAQRRMDSESEGQIVIGLERASQQPECQLCRHLLRATALLKNRGHRIARDSNRAIHKTNSRSRGQRGGILRVKRYGARRKIRGSVPFCFLRIEQSEATERIGTFRVERLCMAKVYLGGGNIPKKL